MDAAAVHVAHDLLLRAGSTGPDQPQLFALALGLALRPSLQDGFAVTSGAVRFDAKLTYRQQADGVLFALAEWGLRSADVAASDDNAAQVVDVWLNAVAIAESSDSASIAT